MQDTALTSSGKYDDPYLDTEVSARFTGPGGETKTVQGFWNGENEFIIRFTPTSVGNWNYTTVSTDKGLNDKKGTIKCISPVSGTHGFLRLDEMHRYHFMYDDGTRYFMFGQTYYGLLTLAKSSGNWKMSVDSTLATGMNKIRMHINGGLSESPASMGKTAGINETAKTINADHFRKADEVIHYMNSRGMIADLIIFPRTVLGNQQLEERYLRYIIARYAAYPNVIWCLINEWNYSARPKEFWNIVGRITKKEDPWATEGAAVRLLSVHQRTRIDFEFFGQDWLSHAIIQYGVRNKAQTNNESEWIKSGKTKYKNGDEWGNAGILYNMGQNIPVVNDEYGYIGEPSDVSEGKKNDSIPITRKKHRQIIWGIYVAGGYASAGDKYLYENKGRPYMNGTWQHPAEYNDITNLVNFYTGKNIEYWKMSGHNAIIKTGKRVYASGNSGEQYIIYAATGGGFTIQLPEGNYIARRFNPATGEDESHSVV